jgi:hypothetical protein
VLFVSYDFPPGARIGAFSCAQIVRYLPSFGWDPVVLSVREQYYEFRDPKLEVPAQVIRTRVLPHPLALYHRAQVSGHHDSTPEPFRDTRPAPGHDARGIAAARDAIVSLLDCPDVYAGWIPPAVIAGVRACRRLGNHSSSVVGALVDESHRRTPCGAAHSTSMDRPFPRSVDPLARLG